MLLVTRPEALLLSSSALATRRARTAAAEPARDACPVERVAATQRLHLPATGQVFHADAAGRCCRGSRRRRSDWLDLGHGGCTSAQSVAVATVARKRSGDGQAHLLVVSHLIEGWLVDRRRNPAAVWHRVLRERGGNRPGKLLLVVFPGLLFVIITAVAAVRRLAVMPRGLSRDGRR